MGEFREWMVRVLKGVAGGSRSQGTGSIMPWHSCLTISAPSWLPWGESLCVTPSESHDISPGLREEAVETANLGLEP